MATTGYKPLFGAVSIQGRLFTVYYEKVDSLTGINRQGYEPSVFKGLQIPIVRFDKASLENVCEHLKGEFYAIDEYHYVGRSNEEVLSLAQHLAKIESKGIPVELGYHP